MKRFLHITAIALFVSASTVFSLSAQAVWDGSIDTEWVGTGTADDPYLISSAAELAGIADFTSKGTSFDNLCFRLTADIVLNDTTNWKEWSPINQPANLWTPIGSNATDEDVQFEGEFDGDNHTISGLFCCDTLTSTRQALFGSTFSCTIQNIHLKAAYVYSLKASAAGLIAFAEYQMYKGQDMLIINCTADAIVHGYSNVGGILGSCYYAYITNCHTSGSVSGVTTNVGGVAGQVESLSASSSTADVSATKGERTGGLVGDCGSGIFSCFATGNVEGVKYVGGLVGSVSSGVDGSIVDCYATGDVSGVGYVGGFAGEMNTDSTANCYATGKVTSHAGYEVGGFVGYIKTRQKNAYIGNCYASGDVIAESNDGGGDANDVGGLFGRIDYSDDATFEKCYATGNVQGVEKVGGLVGVAYSECVLQECYAVGHVLGNEDVGGFVGNVYGPNIKNCYTRGSVAGEDCVGGFVGYYRADSIINCYAANDVRPLHSEALVNGFVGKYHNDEPTIISTIKNIYYDADLSHFAPDAIGARTTEQMHAQATFEGWDFDAIWAIDATKNSGYPYLRNVALYEPTITGLESIVAPTNNAENIRKFYHNGQIYIQRGAELFMIDGRKVK